MSKTLTPAESNAIKEAYQKFRKGDSLSDPELELLIHCLSRSRDVLDCLPREFGFSWRQLHVDVDELESFREARKKKQ